MDWPPRGVEGRGGQTAFLLAQGGPFPLCASERALTLHRASDLDSAAESWFCIVMKVMVPGVAGGEIERSQKRVAGTW